MPANADDQHFEDVSSQLNDGLKSCRAVISGYRTLLSGEDGRERLGAYDAVDSGEEEAA